jgi:hypothetical protein
MTELKKTVKRLDQENTDMKVFFDKLNVSYKIKCPTGHFLKKRKDAPEFYHGSIYCNICEKRGLEFEDGFWRCEGDCDYDMCTKCY